MTFASSTVALLFICERSPATPNLTGGRSCNEGHNPPPRSRNQSANRQRLFGGYKRQQRQICVQRPSTPRDGIGRNAIFLFAAKPLIGRIPGINRDGS